MNAVPADLTPTITVTVRYFAALRETLGCASESVPTQASTVGQLREQLRARGAPYAQALEDEIKAGREFMHEFRDTFHQLAK